MLEGKKVLIFDLGGVLIDLHVERSFAHFVEMGADAAMLTEKDCLLNTRMMQYDRGDISSEEMFDYIASQLSPLVCKNLGNELFDRIHAAWNAMLGCYDPGKLLLLKELRSRGFRVVMLSNTNSGHWGEIERRFIEAAGEPLPAFFDALYLSYRMHCRKPESEIFLRLLSAEGAAASECLFFDDSAENCATARAVGIPSVLVGRNVSWGRELFENHIPE